MSSSDYLALIELHLRNMLATVEGMDDLEASATEGKVEDEKVEDEELGRLLFFHKSDIGFQLFFYPVSTLLIDSVKFVKEVRSGLNFFDNHLLSTLSLKEVRIHQHLKESILKHYTKRKRWKV